jgi:hypothetical protein
VPPQPSIVSALILSYSIIWWWKDVKRCLKRFKNQHVDICGSVQSPLCGSIVNIVIPKAMNHPVSTPSISLAWLYPIVSP